MMMMRPRPTALIVRFVLPSGSSVSAIVLAGKIFVLLYFFGFDAFGRTDDAARSSVGMDAVVVGRSRRRGAEDDEEVPERSQGDHRQCGLRRRASRENADIAADNGTATAVVIAVVVSTTKDGRLERRAGVRAVAAAAPRALLLRRRRRRFCRGCHRSLFQLLLGGESASDVAAIVLGELARPLLSLTNRSPPTRIVVAWGKLFVLGGKTDSSGDARGIPTTYAVVGFGRPSVSVPISYTVRIYVLWLSTD
jgi:hypothetical protein